jgi:hypothetical protein
MKNLKFGIATMSMYLITSSSYAQPYRLYCAADKGYEEEKIVNSQRGVKNVEVNCQDEKAVIQALDKAWNDFFNDGFRDEYVLRQCDSKSIRIMPKNVILQMAPSLLGNCHKISNLSKK